MNVWFTFSPKNGPGTDYLCNVADKTLSPDIKTSQGLVAGAYDWTPDGNSAVWQASTNYDNFQLYFGDPDKAGSGAVLLKPKVDNRYSPDGFRYYGAIRISPDGRTITVGGTSLIFLSVPSYHSPLEGQNFIGGASNSLAWSPDGRALVLLGYEPSLESKRVIHIQNFIGEGSGGKTFELTQNVGKIFGGRMQYAPTPNGEDKISRLALLKCLCYNGSRYFGRIYFYQIHRGKTDNWQKGAARCANDVKYGGKYTQSPFWASDGEHSSHRRGGYLFLF
ncbi:MAG: hypothetical protein WCS37_04415 [Chloroflexota bacterium]|nr:hypothetical protein [Chloroflexota bacterium]